MNLIALIILSRLYSLNIHVSLDFHSSCQNQSNDSVRRYNSRSKIVAEIIIALYENDIRDGGANLQMIKE
jgi:hypothetical protein